MKEVVVTLAGKYILKQLRSGSEELIRRINKRAFRKWKAAGKSKESDMCLGYFAVLIKKAPPGENK